jgi:hypothetical protein
VADSCEIASYVEELLTECSQHKSALREDAARQLRRAAAIEEVEWMLQEVLMRFRD